MSDNLETKETVAEDAALKKEEQVIDGKDEASEVGYSELELKALSHGWIPPEEYKGDPDEYVEAKEFIARGSFFKKIERQNAEINKLKQIVNTMSETLSRAEQLAYDKAMKDIQAQKAQARQYLDMDTYDALVEKEKELISNPQMAQPVKAAQQPTNPLETPEGMEFMQNNSWLSRNDDVAEKMKIHATMLVQKVARENPNQNLSEVLNYVHKEIRREYPQEFRKAGQVSPVLSSKTPAGSSKESSSSKKDEFAGLSDAHVLVAQYLKDNNQDYKDYIKRVKGK